MVKIRATLNLLDEIVELGYDRQESWKLIDAKLDLKYGFGNRMPLSEERLAEEVYDKILHTFKDGKDKDILLIKKISKQ